MVRGADVMATNDQIILKQIIQQRNDEMETKLTESDLFERFVSDQVLKNYDLSYMAFLILV